jgi:hypothetical protein
MFCCWNVRTTLFFLNKSPADFVFPIAPINLCSFGFWSGKTSISSNLQLAKFELLPYFIKKNIPWQLCVDEWLFSLPFVAWLSVLIKFSPASLRLNSSSLAVRFKPDIYIYFIAKNQPLRKGNSESKRTSRAFALNPLCGAGLRMFGIDSVEAIFNLNNNCIFGTYFRK